jgi:hypothetical protein
MYVLIAACVVILCVSSVAKILLRLLERLGLGAMPSTGDAATPVSGNGPAWEQDYPWAVTDLEEEEEPWSVASVGDPEPWSPPWWPFDEEEQDL